MKSSSASESCTLLTMSYHRDFELCRLLCSTIDDMAARDIGHILAVPSSDIPLFSSLKTVRRTLVAQEELIPNWLKKVSLPSHRFTRGFSLTKRNFYVSFRGFPVRGWIAQQLMKLSIAAQVPTETIVHADSDIAFVRPFDQSSFSVGGKTPLLRFPGVANTPTHRPWHRIAAKALGLSQREYFGSDYIAHCVPWRRSVVKAMMERIARSTGQDATVFLSRTRHLSEYILYGVFCEFIMGIEAAGHFASDKQLCKTLWALGGETLTAEDVLGSLDNEIAIGIQSTLPVPIQRRHALVEQLRRNIDVGDRQLQSR